MSGLLTKFLQSLTQSPVKSTRKTLGHLRGLQSRMEKGGYYCTYILFLSTCAYLDTNVKIGA